MSIPVETIVIITRRAEEIVFKRLGVRGPIAVKTREYARKIAEAYYSGNRAIVKAIKDFYLALGIQEEILNEVEKMVIEVLGLKKPEE